jgi:hypothetical protein
MKKKSRSRAISASNFWNCRYRFGEVLKASVTTENIDAMRSTIRTPSLSLVSGSLTIAGAEMAVFDWPVVVLLEEQTEGSLILRPVSFNFVL